MRCQLSLLALSVALVCLGCEDESEFPLEGSLHGVQNHEEYNKHYQLENYSDRLEPHALGSTLIDRNRSRGGECLSDYAPLVSGRISKDCADCC